MSFFTGDWRYNVAKVLAQPVLAPVEVWYGLGGLLNEATGGHTSTYDLGTALRGNTNVVSPFVGVAGAAANLVDVEAVRQAAATVYNFKLPELPKLGDIKKWLLVGGAGVAGLLLLSRR